MRGMCGNCMFFLYFSMGVAAPFAYHWEGTPDARNFWNSVWKSMKSSICFFVSECGGKA